LVCFCAALVAFASADNHLGKKHGGGAILFSRTTLQMYLPYFFLGVLLARTYVLTSTSYYYDRFCQLACSLSLLVLAYTTYLTRFQQEDRWYLIEPWITFWQIVMMLGFAGPRATVEHKCCNPMLSLLSWGPLATMGENLALPLYATNTIACKFVDSFDIFGTETRRWNPGVRADNTARNFEDTHSPATLTPPYACQMALQFLVMHVMAAMIHSSCFVDQQKTKQSSELQETAIAVPSSAEQRSKVI